jgi:D-alanyl-D-alanine carboxypeptidase
MRSLLSQYVTVASIRRTAPKITEVAQAPAPAPRADRDDRYVVAEATRGIELPRAIEKTRRVAVRQQADERLPPRVFSPEPTAKPTTFVKVQHAKPVVEVGSIEPIKPIMVHTMSLRRQPSDGAATADAQTAPRSGTGSIPEGRQIAAAGDAGAAIENDAVPVGRPAARGEWVIQIGAFPAETEAQKRLKVAQNVARGILSGAEPFTERVVKRDTTLYRARFAGFDHERADAACKYLKRNDIVCLALRN